MQRPQFLTHVVPELRIECAERLVHHERLRPADDGAAERHALPIPSRERAAGPVQQRCDLQQGGRLLHPGARLGPAHALGAQREGDVLPHSHVRVEREHLKHKRNVPRARPAVRDVRAAERDGAGRRHLEPRDHPQRRCLTAAGRAQHDEECAVRHGKARALDGGECRKLPPQVAYDDLCHQPGNLPTIMKPTVPARIVTNDQPYSVSDTGCISMTTPAPMRPIVRCSSRRFISGRRRT